MGQRRRKVHPAAERRRRQIIQGVGLAVLVVVAAVMVILALRMP